MHLTDTSPEAQRIYDEKIRSLSENERFFRGLSLTFFCRALCADGIRDQMPGIRENDLRAKLFERIYGDRFPPEEKLKIMNRLSGKGR